MSCVEISFIRNAKDEIFYFLSLFVQRLQEILDIIIFLIGREKTRGEKNAWRDSKRVTLVVNNAYGNPNIYPKTLLHLLCFYEEKSMTHMFTSSAFKSC